MVLRISKSLYDLKQSLHGCYGTSKEIVISIQFVALCVDGGLFILVAQGIVLCAVFLYIDNLLIIANE
jgi:hypothetical protein